MIHLWEGKHAWRALKLRCQLANFNGWPHLRHFEKTVFKRQSTFPEKNQFPDKGFMLSISQERATLHGLGEEICQKMWGFFNLRMSAFITFLFCFGGFFYYYCQDIFSLGKMFLFWMSLHRSPAKTHIQLYCHWKVRKLSLEALTHLSNLTESKQWGQAANYASLKGVLS